MKTSHLKAHMLIHTGTANHNHASGQPIVILLLLSGCAWHTSRVVRALLSLIIVHVFLVCLSTMPDFCSPGGYAILHTPTGEKPFSCPVRGCTMTFSRYDEVTRHRRRHTGFATPFACTVCPSTFASSDHLNLHVANRHGPPKWP